MKVTKRKRCILNHRGRMRILKFGPSRYCCCVTASAKVLRVVSGLFIQLFLCFRILIKNYAIKDSFSHSFTLSRVGL